MKSPDAATSEAAATATITLTPLPGGLLASDGALIMNNLGQRWRDTNNNGTYEPASDQSWDK